MEQQGKSAGWRIPHTLDVQGKAEFTALDVSTVLANLGYEHDTEAVELLFIEEVDWEGSEVTNTGQVEVILTGQTAFDHGSYHSDGISITETDGLTIESAERW